MANNSDVKASVTAGLPPYVPNAKQQFPFLMSDDFEERYNVAWRVETAQPDPANPLVEPKYPWDSGCVFLHGSIMVDPADNLWKAWYLSKPLGKGRDESPAAGRILTYAESEDGVHWVRPELDIALYEGRTRSNILLDLDSGGLAQHPSVILHPDAPPEYRYEMFILRYPEAEGPNSVVRGFPPPKEEPKHWWERGGLFRYHSADGKHWQAWDKIELSSRDSMLVHQLADGTYQTYYKAAVTAYPGGLVPYDVAAGNCRIIVHRTSATGADWTPYETVITPDWLDPADTQFMQLDILPQQGGYIGALCIYHALTQTIDIQWAASRDGKYWWRPDRRPCVPLAPLGEYGGGMIWPLDPLIQHDGRLYLYYAGCDGLHHDYMTTELIQQFQKKGGLPGWPHLASGLHLGMNDEDAYTPLAGMTWFHSAGCRAGWVSGRLWAAVTASGGPMEGMLGTKTLSVAGKRLIVNAATVREGSVEAELLQGDQPIPGFTRADCVPFKGDDKAATMKWKGGDRCPAEKIRARLFLKEARLYSIDWQP